MDSDDDVQKSEVRSVMSVQSEEEMEENTFFKDKESRIEFSDEENNDKDDLAAAASASKRMTYVETARMFKLRRNLDQLDCFRRQKECDILKASEELKLLQQNIRSLLTHKEKLEEEIEYQQAGESSVALFQLQAQHKSLCQELQREKEMAAQINTELRQQEMVLSELEVELGRFSSIQQELYEDEQAFQHLKTQKAMKRLQQESKASQSLQLKMSHLKNKQAVIEQDTTENERKMEDKRANRKTAIKYLKETIKRMREEEAEKERQKSMIIEKRINAVESLKSNIAATHESIRVQQSRPKVNAQKKAQQNQQSESPQAQGINNGSRRQKQLEIQQKQVEFEWQRSKRVKIVTKTLPEQEPMKKKNSQQELVSRPETTGKFTFQNRLSEKLWRSVDPGMVSAIKQGARIYSESSSSSDSSDLEDMQDTLQPGVDHQLASDCLAEPEFPGLWDQKYKTSSYQKLTPISVTQDETPTTTKLNMSTRNVCGARLRGTSFISKPEVVLFTDFEVGETYTKKMILTNSSSMSNNCRLLGLSAQLRDFITINFKMSGPMSSGMSCDFLVTFQPKMNKDMEGEIMFASAAGPFSVPVRCATKKCQVQVDSQTIDFGSQLVGQNISRTITLTNKGALATHFHLDMSPCIIPETQRVQMSFQTPADSSMETSSHLKISDQQMIPASVRSKEVDKQSHDLSEPIPACLPSNVDPRTEESRADSCDIHLPNVKQGEIGPFETINLDIYFTPSIPGNNRLEFKIVFSDLSSRPIPIKVTGLAVTLPVWAAQPSIDLKICMFDHLYQERLQIISRASTALKLTFEVCQEMRRHMEILPKTGCIQAQSHFNVHLKFLPRLSLSKDAEKYFDKNTGVLDVPVMIQVENQVKPIQVTLQAVVTTSDLKFECSEVDFGFCSIYQSIKSTVRLTNLSLLPQEFGFVGVPEFIDVQPNHGFGTLLPQETLEIDLIFSAEKPKEYNFQLTCKTATNREFPLSCRAVGVRPPLALSHSLVQFGVTALGDKSTALLYLSNQYSDKSKQLLSAEVKEAMKAATARLYCFSPPPDSPIRISPSAGRLVPGERCLVQVTFSPKVLDQDIQDEAQRLIQQEKSLHENETENKHAEAKESQVVKTRGMKLSASSKTSKLSDTSRTDSETNSENPELQPGPQLLEEARLSMLKSFKQSFNKYMVPCFVSDGDTPTQDRQAQPEWSLNNTLYLELLCPVIQPPLVVVSSKSHNSIDFQHVAVGERVLQSITVQNISKDSMEISSSLLDLSGPFTQLNTLREIKPGQKQTLTFAFCPSLEKKYCEILEVHCKKMTLEISLKGEGVIHKVSWSHPGGLLDFGYVMEKESSSQVVVLQNTSSVAVDFVMLLSSLAPSELQGGIEGLLENLIEPIVGTQNYNGLCAFSVNPMQGTIEAGKSQDVTVTFQPDQPSLHYSDRLTVQTSNKSKLCAINLKGAASSYNVYVRGGERMTLPVKSLIPPEITFSRLQLEESHEAQRSGIPMLVLLQASCTKDSVQPAVRELQVGCIKSKKSNKKGAEFYLEDVESIEEQGFTVEPSRGSVVPGQSSIITITWIPQSGYKPNDMVQVWVRLTVMGEETLVYNVTLTALVLPQ